MKKLILLLGTLFILSSCTYNSRNVSYAPALPRETRGADYQMGGKIDKTITYYRDYDIHFFPIFVPIPHEVFYYMKDGKKYDMVVEGDTEYDRVVYTMHDLETINAYGESKDADLYLPVAYLIDMILKEQPDTSVLLNVKITDTCEGDYYVVPTIVWNWWMNDRQCELNIKATKGVLK